MGPAEFEMQLLDGQVTEDFTYINLRAFSSFIEDHHFTFCLDLFVEIFGGCLVHSNPITGEPEKGSVAQSSGS